MGNMRTIRSKSISDKKCTFTRDGFRCTDWWEANKIWEKKGLDYFYLCRDRRDWYNYVFKYCSHCYREIAVWRFYRVNIGYCIEIYWRKHTDQDVGSDECLLLYGLGGGLYACITLGWIFAWREWRWYLKYGKVESFMVLFSSCFVRFLYYLANYIP